MLLALLSAWCLGLSAQITVTSATFPVAGDTLRVAYDFDPASITNPATAPGGNQVWNFTALSADETDEIVYLPASAGMNSGYFPQAEMVVKGSSGEAYYNLTNTKLELLGFYGSDAGTLGAVVLGQYAPPRVERHVPLQFFDIFPQESDLLVPFSTEDLPDSLTAGFPFLPDSARVRIHLDRLEVVDGWGTVQIPGGQYPVLRQKRTDFTNTGIDVKLPFLGWQDITTVIPGGGQFGNVIGIDTTISYRFLSGTEKEEIAVATLSTDLSETQSVRFKSNITVAAPETFAPGNANVQAFPNPAIEWVRFDCTNLPANEYTLKIFNIIGKVVWKETHLISGNKSVRIDLENFKKGTYLYSLVDKKGNIIGTKRLVVLKP
jgi:hypothetical protein